MTTMRDVAVRAGVSTKTVSRVFNDDPHVLPGTRASVEQAMRELNYVPNVLATTFRAGRTSVIGVDVPDIAVIPCDEPHVFEAFATTQMPEGGYPGQGEANTAATDFCAREFRSFIGVDYDTSVLELLYFHPVEESWNTEGDRRILCFVAEQDETPVTGTLRDAGR